jgi:hypothetical protein
MGGQKWHKSCLSGYGIQGRLGGKFGASVFDESGSW